MPLDSKNIYSFDECSILNQCVINVPEGFAVFFASDKLFSQNLSKLRMLTSQLKLKSIPKYKFVPSNFESNIIKVANALIDETGVNLRMLPDNVKYQIAEQIEEFKDEICNSYKDITKDNNIAEIKDFFEKNKKELTKKENIPDDDDCKIIAGYCKIACEGYRYLISYDEHFWGYSKEIHEEYKISPVPEWKCHTLC